MTTNTFQTQAFIAALAQDSRLQAQFELASPTSLGAVVDFASAQGYQFTKEELEATFEQVPNSAVVEQLRQYVGSLPMESGIIRNLFSRYFGFRLPSPQPSRLM
ncbi:MAG: Nif11-like leader peptide family natural product precursor [Anaerolineae bacterium]|nr:Nif11-like leader peptide family natural product precursor [Anaerolineae bacterium]